MATGIPLPGAPGESLLKGINTGSSMFARMMQPVVQREQLAQQMKIHQDALALQKAAAGRAAMLAPLQQRLAQLHIAQAEMETDPAKKMAYIQQIMQGIHGMGGASQGGDQSLTGGQPQQPMSPFGGMGMPSTDEMLNPTVQAPQSQPLGQQGFGQMQGLGQQQGMGGFTPEQQMALGMAGIKLPTIRETPEQKRFSDLQSKIQFEQQKTALKKKALEDKEIVAAQKDIPTIKNSLEGVDELLKIAKENPDMFGHTFAPDRYAKVSQNKNFGTWQNLIADRIAGLEGKLSSRGNIVALKMAASLKPSHGESQMVALGKLESMKKELQKQLQRSQALTGQAPEAQKLSGNSSMDLSKMSDEELQQLAAGG